jgi:hypothetical protein
MQKLSFFFISLLSLSAGLSRFPRSKFSGVHSSRRNVIEKLSSITLIGILSFAGSSQAFSIPGGSQSQKETIPVDTNTAIGATVAYRSLNLNVDRFDVTVPVGLWYPTGSSEAALKAQSLTYSHRISIKRIGQLLAGWDFIPELLSRKFELEPTLSVGSVVDGTSVNIPTKSPVVFLAHGYLGSRFDLSHLAEALAQEGFICVSPEYPESLAASYPRVEGLDRQVINNQLITELGSKWKIQATSYGIVGHSLGCGTAISTGDASWTRVCIAGFPRQRDGSPIPGDVLFLTSMNDGAVSLSRFGGKEAIPLDFSRLEESELTTAKKLPRRASLVFDRPDAPNHISFLTDGVNNAMIDLLSPLLPVAQALSIPVLDFDKYKDSRDSKQTADVVIPLVVSYFKQFMV